MANIKWIKIATDVFDSKKIKQIETLPDGDTIIVIWFKLLVLAGNINDNGFVYFTKDIPYTDQMLANYFNRPLSTVQLALNIFQQFEMIEIIDDILFVSNWEEYQNIEGMEKIREQTRERVAKHRERKKLECNVTSNVTVTQCNATDIDIDKDIDIKDISKDISSKKTECENIVSLFNSICVSLSKVQKLSDKRLKILKTRLKTYSTDDFRKVFEKAEASDFLSGRNGAWGGCGFDWLIIESNMIKVLEGNYDNKNKKSNTDMMQRNNIDKLRALEERALKGDY